jgi:ribosomal protein L7Ae-like RNA K-turn-binding protein
VKTKEEIISIYSKTSWYPREKLGEVEAIKAVRFKNIKEVIITSSAKL